MLEVTTRLVRDFNVHVQIREHSLTVEPVTSATSAENADPLSLLLASLGSSTIMALQTYAQSQGWLLADLSITLIGRKSLTNDQLEIRRRIYLPKELNPEQFTQLQVIACNCEIYQLLNGSATIRDSFGRL